MVESLGSVILKTGETVSAAVIPGPDASWGDRLENLLKHKGDPWNWQNSALLREETGVDSSFYVLHRDGIPFAHQMTATVGGVGLFGHVWTEPADRGKGAAGLLMNLQMTHFQSHGGRALVLGTGYDTPPYHLYRKHGFHSIEPGSGIMSWSQGDFAEFRAAYLAPSTDAVIEPLAWRHWPVAPVLFAGELPGVVRNVALGLWGRCNTEEPLLKCLHDPTRAQVSVLRLPNGAVAGLASRSADALVPGATCIDICLHPAHDQHGEVLLSGILAVGGTVGKLTAYADEQQPDRWTLLERHGFRRTKIHRDLHPSGMPVHVFARDGAA